MSMDRRAFIATSAVALGVGAAPTAFARPPFKVRQRRQRNNALLRCS